MVRIVVCLSVVLLAVKQWQSKRKQVGDGLPVIQPEYTLISTKYTCVVLLFYRVGVCLVAARFLCSFLPVQSAAPCHWFTLDSVSVLEFSQSWASVSQEGTYCAIFSDVLLYNTCGIAAVCAHTHPLPPLGCCDPPLLTPYLVIPPCPPARIRGITREDREEGVQARGAGKEERNCGYGAGAEERDRGHGDGGKRDEAPGLSGGGAARLPPPPADGEKPSGPRRAPLDGRERRVVRFAPGLGRPSAKFA